MRRGPHLRPASATTAPDIGTPPGRRRVYAQGRASAPGRSRSRPGWTYAAYWGVGWRDLTAHADVPDRHPPSYGCARASPHAGSRQAGLRLRRSRDAGPRHIASWTWRHPSRAAAAPRSSPSTTSPPCSPPSPATCGGSSASATGSCARRAAHEALDALKELVTRGEQVALLVADQRMPRHVRDRVPGRGAQARARRQARAADRLRRHRGRDPGDQRGRPRLLPAQAVGPARGAAVPGRRGPADDVGGGRGARVRRRARDRPPLQPRLARPARLPGPQPRADALARRRARRARRASC